MKGFFKGILTALVMATMFLGLWGCERQGPAEQAGEQVDEAVEEGREQVEDLNR
ncbi:MAG: transport-associated protein [Desulfomonilia bacterium]